MPHEGSGWSPLLYRTEGAVTYAVWKKPWKGGLNAYKSTTTIRGVSADELYRCAAITRRGGRLSTSLRTVLEPHWHCAANGIRCWGVEDPPPKG